MQVAEQLIAVLRADKAVLHTQNTALRADNTGLKAGNIDLKAGIEKAEETASERKDELEASNAATTTYKSKIADLRQKLRHFQTTAVGSNDQQQRETPGTDPIQTLPCQVCLAIGGSVAHTRTHKSYCYMWNVLPVHTHELGPNDLQHLWGGSSPTIGDAHLDQATKGDTEKCHD